MAASQPWLDNEDWDGGVVRSNSRSYMWIAWAFCGFWNAISMPLVFVIPKEMIAGNYPALIGLLFPLVGVGLIMLALKRTREWRTYGPTTLRLDPFPGSVGGDVGGVIDLNTPVATQIGLECVRSCVSGSGKNRSRKEEIVWQLNGSPVRRQDGLAFKFPVPGDLPTTEPKDGSYHFWRLNLRSVEDCDVPLDRSFEIPVYATAEQSETIDVDTAAGAEDAMADQLANAVNRTAPELLEQHGLTLGERDGWLRMMFPTGRMKGTAFVLALIGLAFGGTGVSLSSEGFFMGVCFTLVGFALLGFGVYLPFNSLDVRVSPQKVRCERRWLGRCIRFREFPPAATQSVEIKQSSSTSVNGKTTVRYKLVAKTTSHGDATIAEGIVGRSAARAVRSMFLEHAGLRIRTTD